ncbi:MAG: hypothetical protein HC894_05210 [Microcoleus sp. SM1_3_4]|nr:hypothetical protein [Microcoleus sp. SM1_3_4]
MTYCLTYCPTYCLTYCLTYCPIEYLNTKEQAVMQLLKSPDESFTYQGNSENLRLLKAIVLERSPTAPDWE